MTDRVPDGSVLSDLSGNHCTQQRCDPPEGVPEIAMVKGMPSVASSGVACERRTRGGSNNQC